ncbi:MAG: membrane integrity-associated transporter subunit PqiC [Deltaproteobacteria bacterium]|nr:membrane integrity-associated transporter subunit PqiC [Deltaproteobacteria bacterium]
MVTMKNILLIITIFISLSLMSCMNLKQPNPEIAYYTLEYNSPVFSGKERLPHFIKVEPFKVSPVYNTTHIIYQERPFKRNSYTYHRWSVNPADIITYLVGRDLKNSGLFKGIILPGERSREYTFRLGAMVDEFYELDGEEEWSGVLSLSITLAPEGKAKKAGMDIFQKSYSVTEKLDKKNPASLAQALSRGMEKISLQIGEDLYAFIKDGMKN